MQDSWYRIAWAFLKAGGVGRRVEKEEEEEEEEGEEGEGGEGVGRGEEVEGGGNRVKTGGGRSGGWVLREGRRHIGKKRRLQLYQYPRRYRYPPGCVEVRQGGGRE